MKVINKSYVAKKKENNSNVDKHKIWLIAGISVVILIVAMIFLYPAFKEGFGGKAVEQGKVIALNIALQDSGSKPEITITSGLFSQTIDGTSTKYVLYTSKLTSASGQYFSKKICSYRSSVPGYHSCTSQSAISSPIYANNNACFFVTLIPNTGTPTKANIYGCLNPSESNCNNNIDDDQNGLTDCADPNCKDKIGGPSNELCELGKEINCDDSFDNDRDGKNSIFTFGAVIVKGYPISAEKIDASVLANLGNRGASVSKSDLAQFQTIVGRTIPELNPCLLIKCNVIYLKNNFALVSTPNSIKILETSDWKLYPTSEGSKTPGDIQSRVATVLKVDSITYPDVTLDDVANEVAIMTQQAKKSANPLSGYIVAEGAGGTDCNDYDCKDYSKCIQLEEQPKIEDCTNEADDDSDFKIDCVDESCFEQSCGEGCLCVGGNKKETQCADLINNDKDLEGLIDCADTDCSADAACVVIAEYCTDSDGTNYFTKETVTSKIYPDGKEDYCYTTNGKTYLFEGTCTDNKYAAINKNCGELFPYNSYTCKDGACVATETNCADGKDDDNNGLVDCADPKCTTAKACQTANLLGDPCATTNNCDFKNGLTCDPTTKTCVTLTVSVSGDANDDKVVDIFDALAIVESINAGTTSSLPTAADANCDGLIDIFDALAIVESINAGTVLNCKVISNE